MLHLSSTIVYNVYAWLNAASQIGATLDWCHNQLQKYGHN